MSEMEAKNDLQEKTSASAVDEQPEAKEEHPMESHSTNAVASPDAASSAQTDPTKKEVIVIRLTSMHPQTELKHADNIKYAGPEDKLHALENGDQLVHVVAADGSNVYPMNGPTELLHNMHAKDMYAVFLVKRTGLFKVFHIKYSGDYRPTYRYITVDDRVIVLQPDRLFD